MKEPTSQPITSEEHSDGPEAVQFAPEYTLEYLAACTDTDVQAFLRESSPNDLSRIVYVASDALRDRLFANLSSAAQLEILDKMLCSPPESEEEVKDAVKVSVHTLAKLEAEGIVKVPRKASGLGTPRTFQPGPIRPIDVPRQILEYDWAAGLRDLRGAMHSLSPGEMRQILQRVSNRDLTILVCTSPFDQKLLEQIGRGLAPAAYEMIRADCEEWTDAEPLHDFIAYTTLKKAIDRIERARANAQDIAQFKTLGLRLMAYGDEEFQHVVKEHLRNELLVGLMRVLGGLNGPWAKRLQHVLSEAAWLFLQEDYGIVAEEPLTLVDVHVFDLPKQLEKIGHPLPKPIKEPLTSKYPALGKLARWLPRGR